MFRLLILFCVSFGVLGNEPQERCNITDNICTVNFANRVYSSFFEISNELDPMQQDVVDTNLSELQYKFTDTTIKGFKNCKIEYIKFDIQNLFYHDTFFCPQLDMNGKYDITGHLNQVPIEGSGTFTMHAPQFSCTVRHYLELESSEDGSRMRVKNFTVELNPRERIVTNLDNLFNGDEEKAARVTKLFNEEWKEATNVLYSPMFDAIFENVHKVGNSYLKNNHLKDNLIF